MMDRVWKDGEGTFLQAWGIVPPDLSAPREDQAAAVFGKIESILGSAGMTFANVLRTWFYCDRINEWYGGFNAARTAFFGSVGIGSGRFPASTGIGFPNPFGAALVAGFVAKSPAGFVTVGSPLQEDAFSYGSSFSRAVETDTARGRVLFVSGTASILPGSGEVAFVGDPVRQMECAMSAALAIVESRGMSESDVSRMTVYLKSPEYAALWKAYSSAHPDLPRADVMIADVCRPEWLFEVEMDAVKRP